MLKSTHRERGCIASLTQWIWIERGSLGVE